ncbi:MAG: WD40 repeat protein [Patiriisocius sp.]|jgi:WD40 repeat protein
MKIGFILTISLVLFYCNCSAQKILTIGSGHGGNIEKISYSPNGKYFATASQDYSIKIWDVQQFTELRTLKGHTEYVYSVAFNPSGNLIASAGKDKKIILWDVYTGLEIKTIDAPYGVFDLSFSDNGKYLACALYEGQVLIYNAETGEFLQKLKGLKKSVLTIDFSPNNKYVVAAGIDRKVAMWNIETGQLIFKLRRHRKRINEVHFSESGNYIVSASDDKTVMVWSTDKGKNLAVLKGHTNDVTSAKFSTKEDFVVSASHDKQILVWNWKKKELVKRITGHANWINSIDLDKTGEHALAAGWDAEIGLYSLEERVKVKTFMPQSKDVRALAVSSSGKYIASVNGKFIVLWNTETSEKVKILTGHNWMINSLKFTQDEKSLFSAGTEGFINLWDISTQKVIHQFAGHNGWVTSLDVSPDGNLLVSCGVDNTIRIWDIKSTKQVKLLRGHINDVNSVRFSSDGRLIVSASADNKVKVWDAYTGVNLHTFNGHTYDVSSAAFSPDNTQIVSAAIDYTVKIWDIASQSVTHTFYPDNFLVSDVGFSPDGQYVISARHNSQILKWEVATGKCDTLRGHTDWVAEAQYGPKGQFIYSCAGDGLVKIWDASTNQVLVSLLSLSNSAEDYVVFTPDGKFEGSKEGLELLYFVDSMNILPLWSLYEQKVTPKLLKRVVSKEDLGKGNIKPSEMLPPPLVQFISESYFSDRGAIIESTELNKTKNRTYSLQVKITDNGGGVEQIRVFNNGKLVVNDSIQETTFKGNSIEKTYEISLLSGQNVITVSAFNSQHIETINKPSRSVYYEGVKPTATLYCLILGVNEYKNNKYNLSYAVPDAYAIKEQLAKSESAIFTSTEIVYLTNSQVNKEHIEQTLDSLRELIQPEDVFLFYYAGHGLMSQEDNPMFYIAPYDLTNMYGQIDALVSKGISAMELQHYSASLKAQKQLFILDACQSGGVTEMLASRGMAEEKAIAQLAYSTGTYWLTASGSNQNAIELSDLGHGVFTYCLLLGLDGNADVGTIDQKITVKELSTFLDEKVPELSEKHKGRMQFPSIFGFGNDFPIIIVDR